MRNLNILAHSTLFNTNTGNNFIYKITPNTEINISDFNNRTYKSPTGESKLTYRLNELKGLGAKIEYTEIQSRQLWKNLKMIDGDLPEILAYALYFRWTTRTSSLNKVIDILEENDPLNLYFGEKSIQKLYRYKISRFLTESAMGMTSEEPWMGDYDKFGGVIVAKKDGDIVAFHIYDFNLFRKYLVENTMFEQPSTGEDEKDPGNPKLKKGTKKFYYGWLYENLGELFFKINLQIRFK